MKRILMILLVLLFVFISAGAVSESENMGNLSVLTEECPVEMIAYVEEEIGDFILSVTEGSIPDCAIYVGTPFSYINAENEMFLFPIFFGDRIEYVLRVSNYENMISGTMSKFLTDELNQLMAETSYDMPVKFYIDDRYLMAEIGDEEKEIYEFTEEETGNSISVANFNDMDMDLSVLNIAEPLDIKVELIQGKASSNYISLNISREQQGDNSWCCAYCTAICLRYRGYDCVAKDVMSYFFGSNPSKNQTLSDARAVEYAKSVGWNDVGRSGSYFSDSRLKGYIDDDSPVMLIMYRPAEDSYHAVVLRGYNSSKWSIWNPWYSSYESFEIGRTYTAKNGHVYVYGAVTGAGRTIYNW